jgi:hypothetical protein
MYKILLRRLPLYISILRSWWLAFTRLDAADPFDYVRTACLIYLCGHIHLGEEACSCFQSRIIERLSSSGQTVYRTVPILVLRSLLVTSSMVFVLGGTLATRIERRIVSNRMSLLLESFLMVWAGFWTSVLLAWWFWDVYTVTGNLVIVQAGIDNGSNGLDDSHRRCEMHNEVNWYLQ